MKKNTSRHIAFRSLAREATLPFKPTSDEVLQQQHDQRAKELALHLGGAKGAQLVSRAAHDQLSKVLAQTNFITAISNSAAGQWAVSRYDDHDGHTDFLIVPDGPELPQYLSIDLLVPLSRAFPLLARSPLTLLHRFAQSSSAGLALWLLWYRDECGAWFPIVVAFERSGAAAGWVVGMDGHWWAILSLDCGIGHLLKHHTGKRPAELEDVRKLLESFGVSTQGKVDSDNPAFRQVLAIYMRAQGALLRSSFATSRRCAELQEESTIWYRAASRAPR